ncbi:MAG: serine hydrolase, partial [Verrucomicrobiota bacterium]
SEDGVSIGGFGLKVRTEDIACFGQLYLRRGTWEGRQLLSEEWVDAATRRQTSNGSNPDSDWEQGYGYQFWRCRHGAYRGDGAFGQFCLVLPEQDAVIAITSGTRNMGRVMDLVWEKLLPGFREKPLEADPVAMKLRERLDSLELPAVEGGGRPKKMESRVALIPMAMEANALKIDSLQLVHFLTNPVLSLEVAGRKHEMKVGIGKWATSSSEIARVFNPRAFSGSQPIAASGAWTADAVFETRIWFTETPFALDLKLSFDDKDGVTVTGEHHVAFGPRKIPELRGTLR